MKEEKDLLKNELTYEENVEFFKTFTKDWDLESTICYACKWKVDPEINRAAQQALNELGIEYKVEF